MHLKRFLLLVISALIVVPIVAGQTKPLSERVVTYSIDAKYDAKTHSLDGVETLTYHNYTGQNLDHFPFHLYLNAFQKRSTFNEESRRKGGFRTGMGGQENKGEGGIDLKQFDVIAIGDGKSTLTLPTPQNLLPKVKFISPDDGNPNDKTVIEVPLPQPVPPGGEVTFRIGFHDTFPEVVARTGYKRDFILGGQWFPKVGVWWQGAWNCHQFHENSEFFADFGVYTVNLTLPANFILGATGVQTGEKNNGDGTKTVSFHAEDVHDFAWTADPNYQVVTGSYTNSEGLTTNVRFLMQPEHMDSAERYKHAALGSLKKFDEFYGPYPYTTLTVVDPPRGGTQAGGMEYPTFITAGTSWRFPKGLLEPELVTEHEFGHQYWYGMVATNEFENAWLDEGINSYSEVKVMDALYGKNTSVINMYGLTGSEREMQRQSYVGAADLDPMTTFAWKFVNSNAYGAITYGKTATVLLTLEGLIGEDKVQQGLRTYFQKYKFTHPTEQDFLRTMSEVAGQDLTWFWQQAVYGTNVLDYEILSATSMNNDWSSDKWKPGKKGETVYETNVVVHRKGDFVIPVQLEVKFDNGEVVREIWDGRSRWHRFTWEKKAQLVSAEIDTNQRFMLDKNFYNNSYTRDSNGAASSKITSYWMIVVQWFSQMLAWLT